MHQLVQENLQHIMCAAILVARAADAGTTLLATPRFKLEANPLMRRYRLPMILASLGLCLVPYVTINGAVVVLVMSLLVSVSNSLRLWLVKSIGEEEYHAILLRAAAGARLRLSLFLNVLPGLIMTLLALMLYLYYPDPDRDPGFYFATGILVYALMIIVYYPCSFLRARRLALQQAAAQEPTFRD